jgi:hypothetical protein
MAQAHCIPHTYGYKYTEYVLHIAFPLQQWLNEQASVFLYRCTDCLLGTRHVQMKPVRKFSWSNYWKALKWVPLRTVAVRTISCGQMRCVLQRQWSHFKNPLFLFIEYSSNTFYLKKPTWGLHTLKMNFKKSNHYISSRLEVKAECYRNFLQNFH